VYGTFNREHVEGRVSASIYHTYVGKRGPFIRRQPTENTSAAVSPTQVATPSREDEELAYRTLPQVPATGSKFFFPLPHDKNMITRCKIDLMNTMICQSFLTPAAVLSGVPRKRCGAGDAQHSGRFFIQVLPPFHGYRSCKNQCGMENVSSRWSML